ncbi:Uncharacterised protein [Bacillus freudenreichii]|nr:Uncharacterised protein [Bacillus freudenreichii]
MNLQVFFYNEDLSGVKYVMRGIVTSWIFPEKKLLIKEGAYLLFISAV